MMADKLADELAGATLDTAATTLSFANRGLRLNTEQDAAEIVEAIAGFQNLRSLVLEGNTLGVDAAKAIGKALEGHPEIQEIHGRDLFTGRMKTEIPRALRFLCNGLMLAGAGSMTFVGSGLMLAGARLTVLDVSDNAVGPVGMDGLHVLLTSPVCYTLQRLLVNNNGWGPAGGTRLADCLIECHQRSVRDGAPMKLREFVSGRSRLEDVAARRLAEFFKRVKTMEKVVMPQNGIYHEGIEALAEALSQNPALQHLDLNDNTFTAKGARALARSLPLMTELRVLNLNDCLLRAAGARALADVLRDSNPKLEELHMAFNEITSEAAVQVVEATVGRKCLSVLELDGNQLGRQGIEAVRAAAAEHGASDRLGGFSEDESEPNSEEGEEEEEEEEEEEGEDEPEEQAEESGEEHVSPLKRTEEIPVKYTLAQFLSQPTPTRLLGLGSSRRQQLTQEATSVQDPSDPAAVVRRHLELLSAVCRASPAGSPDVVPDLVDALLQSALAAATEHNVGLFSNTLLVYLGLIKCEDKQFSVTWDVKGMIVALTRAVQQPYFPASVRDTLQTFLSRPNKTIDVHPAQKHLLMQALFQ